VESARTSDINKFTEIKGNPISKVGVFQYLGRSISAECEPDRIYNVYRPAEELSHPDCINSFKLLPLVDDHAMLGVSEDGLLPAEEKGVHGVIGEDVYFDFPYLRSNLKLFSQKLGGIIDAGKKDLSAGYRCLYEKASGVFDGKPFDYIQRSIRGNHLALVDEGRMGRDVAVLDHLTFTIDAKELPIMNKEEIKAVLDEALKPVLDANVKLTERVAKLQAAHDAAEEEEKKATEDADAEEEAAKKAETGEDADEDKDDKKDGMDAAETKKALKETQDALEDFRKNGIKSLMVEASRRDALAEKVSHFIGAFDFKEKTLNEVAVYAADKLDIKAPKGAELAYVEGFLHNREVPKAHKTAEDAKAKSSEIDSYLTAK
jgi:hypothetical protein